MVAELLLQILAHRVVGGDRGLDAAEHAVEQLCELADRLAVSDSIGVRLNSTGTVRSALRMLVSACSSAPSVSLRSFRRPATCTRLDRSPSATRRFEFMR